MPGVLIEVYRNGQRYGLRRWNAVPRVGDEIVLRVPDRSDAPDVGFAHKVTQVLWGVNLDDEDKRFGTGAVTVRLFTEEIA